MLFCVKFQRQKYFYMTDIDFFSYLDYHRQVIIYQKKKELHLWKKIPIKRRLGEKIFWNAIVFIYNFGMFRFFENERHVVHYFILT